MANKWLKSDWSLAYLLYYIFWLGYWGIILTAIVQTITISAMLQDGTQYIYDIPVNMHLEQFSDFRDFELENVNINISKITSGTVGIEVPLESNITAFLFYNGIKIYNAAVLFLILFMLAKVLKNVAEDNPFHPKNPFYLYIVGWTLFISSVIDVGISFLPMPILSNLVLPDGYEITSLDIAGDSFMMLGILVIVISYVFKEGARIHEEQKLTV